MDRNETKRLLMGIDSIFPTKAAPDLTLKVDLWHSILEDVPLEDALKTLKAYAKTNDFAPKPHTFTKLDEESGPSVPSYDETMFRLYVEEHFTKVVNPETLETIDYIPKQKPTEEEIAELDFRRIVQKVLMSVKLGIQPNEEDMKAFNDLKKSNQEIVDKLTDEFNVPYKGEPVRTINMKQLQEDRAKGQKRLAEIKAGLNK